MEQKADSWWLGVITEMQSTDSGILLLCCSATGQGVGSRKVKSSLKAAVQLQKQNTPPKELKITIYEGK